MRSAHAAHQELLDVVLCPECGERALEVTAKPSGFGCRQCAATFPAAGSIPCLMPNAAQQLRRWRKQAGGLMVMLSKALQRIEQDLGRFDLLPATRQRLERLRNGNVKNQQEVTELLSSLGLKPDLNAPDMEATAGQLPLTEHYELLFRDWAWEHAGIDENRHFAERALAALKQVEKPIRRIAVFGAGAGRLSYDLHQAIEPELTVAIDNNPLLLAVAERVLSDGEALLREFPLVPKTVNDACIERRLQRPGPKPHGLQLLLADALQPPLVPGNFDLVVTSWFVDVVGEDIREMVGLLHALLPDGGVWLNQGPLIHGDQQQARLRYLPQEVLELVEIGGFELQAVCTDTLQHLKGPGSAHARLEEVHTFVAKKQPLVAKDDDHDPPRWVILPHLPVPQFAGLAEFRQSSKTGSNAAAKHPAVQRVMALIDDQRSLDDIAEVLLDEGLVPPSVAPRDGTAAILLSIYQSCSRPAGS